MSYFGRPTGAYEGPTGTYDQGKTEAFSPIEQAQAGFEAIEETKAGFELGDEGFDAGEQEPPPTVGERLAGFRSRVTRALHNLDRGPIHHYAFDPGEHGPTDAPGGDVVADVPPPSADDRFPIGPIGYNRAAVDERIAELEQELGKLREINPAVSITDEIERLGEQTASILVVAHGQAHETTRLAQEQADRCLADAASDAEAITTEAKRRLQELDNETDTVWRERERLLDDARNVGLALIALAEEAAERFPADVKVTDARQPQL